MQSVLLVVPSGHEFAGLHAQITTIAVKDSPPEELKTAALEFGASYRVVDPSIAAHHVHMVPWSDVEQIAAWVRGAGDDPQRVALADGILEGRRTKPLEPPQATRERLIRQLKAELALSERKL